MTKAIEKIALGWTYGALITTILNNDPQPYYIVSVIIATIGYSIYLFKEKQ